MPKVRTICIKTYEDIEVISHGKPDAKLAAKLLTPIIQRIWLKQHGFEEKEISSFLQAQKMPNQSH